MTLPMPGANFSLPEPSPPPKTERPAWQVAGGIILGFTALLYVIEVFDQLTRNSLDGEGIRPRTLGGLWGILWAPMLHYGWGHLLANTIPVIVLGFLVLVTGITRGLTATAIIWVVGGLGTWLTGWNNSVHLGASVLVFGWLAFLLTLGLFTRKLTQILLGLVILLVYGSLLWGILPGAKGVSWQGHLFGLLGGVAAAWLMSSEERGARAAKRAKAQQ